MVMPDTLNTDDKHRLLSLADAAKQYRFNRRYLAELAKKGRLTAQKIGNMWLTTPHDMEVYIASREQRGAYRDDIQIEE